MSAVLSEVRPHALRTQATPQRDAAHGRSTGGTFEKRACGAGFAELLTAYRRSGGTTREDDLAPLLQDHRQGDYISLARLIGAGRVFGFKWRQTVWIPMFQFDPIDLSATQGLREVLSELVGVFDSWQRAAWFAEPNPWLAGRRSKPPRRGSQVSPPVDWRKPQWNSSAVMRWAMKSSIELRHPASSS